MLAGGQVTEGTRANHPLAFRMGVIAFLANNITIGTLFGSFSVLLGSVEHRLGVGRELSTLAIPALNLGMAICAPFVGGLAGRLSLRLMMLTGSVFLTAAFLLLATTASYPLYLAAYGLLLGPGMAFGVILPATLVTRWFVNGRGRALGIMTAPIFIAILPLVTTGVLQSMGLVTAYLMLAGLGAVSVIATLFIVDHPPVQGTAALGETGANADAHGAAKPTITVMDLLRSPRFWGLTIPYAASSASSVILGAHMAPMAATWGFSPTQAAILLSVMSLIGIAGTVFFGWVADKLGGATALTLIVFDAAVLWALLLLHPPFPLMVVLIGLIGLHGAGVLPVIGLVLSQTFGQQNFGQVYGIANMINLPFAVLCVPLASLAFTTTGSYSLAFMGQIVFFGIATVLALSARPSKAELATG